VRYYSVKLTNPDTGALIVPRSLAGLNTGSSYTSTSNGLSSGTPLLGAMNINIDIPVAPYAEPAGQGWVQLEGPALAEISQANNLNGAGIEVYGGFTAGLPLENPKQAGLLVKGTVFPAFGNWIDVEQTLDLIIVPPLGSDSNPVNITGTWQKGTQLAGVLAIVLTNAFPGLADPVINISPNLVATEDQPWAYNNLQQFAEYLKETTAALINSPNYRGVDISLKGNQIVVSDGTVSTARSVDPAIQMPDAGGSQYRGLHYDAAGAGDIVCRCRFAAGQCQCDIQGDFRAHQCPPRRRLPFGPGRCLGDGVRRGDDTGFDDGLTWRTTVRRNPSRSLWNAGSSRRLPTASPSAALRCRRPLSRSPARS